ncbi:unnamed protein product [Merluccius merluccius]
MKAAIIFTLLLTTVLCRPARRPFSSSESSEEQVVVDFPSLVKSVITDIFSESASLPDPSPTPDSASDHSQDDDDDDDDDDTSEETEENETKEDESTESSESGEPSTPSPVTMTTATAVVTEEPTADATPEPVTATVVTDQGRGDSLSRYPSDYKTILYVEEDKSYQKVPSPYKSYELLDGGKKMAYDMADDNEVEKGLKVYKALQVHADLLEEDTSTPEVESQGLDTSFGASSPDQEASPRQALLPGIQEQEVSFRASDASTAAPTQTSSATEEEEEESTASASNSASASQESEDSEDATATPGAADSQSDESDSSESDSDEEGTAAPAATTDMPAVVTAK